MGLFSKSQKAERDLKLEFYVEYKKLAQKHGFDLESVGMLIGFDGTPLPAQRTKQFSKELQEFLAARKVKFLFDFRIISLQDAKQSSKP